LLVAATLSAGAAAGLLGAEDELMVMLRADGGFMGPEAATSASEHQKRMVY